MTYVEICPDCQNPVKVYENGDGTAKGRCLCGRVIMHDHTGHREEETPSNVTVETVIPPIDRWYYSFISVGGGVRSRGAYTTLLEAERACTDYAKKGQRCYVEQMHEIISDWIDGERDDLKRKFIRVEFNYTTHEGQRAEGSSTVVTTQDEPTYKAIEYYLLKRSFQVVRYTVTDDDGHILEQKEVQ